MVKNNKSITIKIGVVAFLCLNGTCSIMASSHETDIYNEHKRQTFRSRCIVSLSNKIDFLLEDVGDHVQNSLATAERKLDKIGKNIYEKIKKISNPFRSSTIRVSLPLGSELRVSRKPFEILEIAEEIEEGIKRIKRLKELIK